MEGGHATPCLAPPLDLASRAGDILGEDAAKGALLYTGVDKTVDELVRWFEEGNLSCLSMGVEYLYVRVVLP